MAHGTRSSRSFCKGNINNISRSAKFIGLEHFPNWRRTWLFQVTFTLHLSFSSFEESNSTVLSSVCLYLCRLVYLRCLAPDNALRQVASVSTWLGDRKRQTSVLQLSVLCDTTIFRKKYQIVSSTFISHDNNAERLLTNFS